MRSMSIGWLLHHSYLWGVLKIVRTDDDNLNNANAGVGIASTSSAKIKNFDDYEANFKTATNFTYAAKTPGSWANI